jgi:hypothetical protein
MTTLQKSALGLALAVLVGFGIYEATLAHSPHHELAQPAALRASHPSAATIGAPPPAAPVVAPAAAPAPGDADARSPLEQRVALLRQLLNELPAQRLPELRLLSAADWLEVARKHNLESSADIRVALADLRAMARKNFAEALQGALRDYTTASGGQLPDDIAQLAPRLVAPADAEMLARYDLLRTGKLGDASEKLVREKKTSDMILSVGLDGWSLNNNPDQPPAFGETEDDTIERTWRALATALGDDAKADMDAMGSPTAFAALMKDSFQNLIPIYGGDDAFGDALKQAVKNFQAGHPAEPLDNVAQVLPYLSQADKFAEAIRPALAQLAYLKEHGGPPPADPAALQPYLNRPFNPAEALQEMKLTTNDGQFSITYNWAIKK